MSVIHIPVLRWGRPYESLETEPVVHFETGEEIAELGQANGGLVARDLRKSRRAREALREIPVEDLLGRVKRAAELFMSAELPLGDGTQTPDDFVHQQSATTGLPLAMCRANMAKLEHVLGHIDEILAALTRGLDMELLSRGWGEEDGVMRSYQAQTAALGLVLPSNSPGVHSLWLPVVPLQIGLVLKPGSREPWTPWRIVQAFLEAGIPAEALALYPGGHDVGAAIMEHASRSLIFGSAETVAQHAGDPRIQVHGPGFSKVLLGDDRADDWEEYLDLMEESVLLNGGRSCINCSGIWTPRHGRAIAAALAERLGPIDVRPYDDPEARLAAFTVPGQAEAIDADIEASLGGAVEEVTAATRDGDRLVEAERCAWLRPTVVFSPSAEAPIAHKEYMFPFVTVVECPQERMLRQIGPTLVATAITEDDGFRRQLLDSTDIDRLNFGPIPTTRIDWLQPHEGNIVEFLYRARAFQVA